MRGLDSLRAFRASNPPATVSINGRDWRYIASDADDGAPALIMLPGAFGAAELFWNQITDLGSRLRIVAATYPPADDVCLLADDIAGLMDHLGLASANLLGTSLGGYILQHFAGRHGARVETLFLANSLTRTDQLARDFDRAAIVARTGGEIRAGVEAGIAAYAETDPAVAALKQILVDHGRHCLTDDMVKSRMLALATLAEPPPLAVPDDRIVLVECDDDPVIAEAGRADMRARYAGAPCHRLISGHFPYVTRADRYSAIIAERLLT